MQGHVDGLGVVQRLKKAGGGLAMTIKAAPEHLRFLTPKGSVAIDGVSLTVDEGPFTTGFTVNLIPHTLTATHFPDMRAGEKVNLEMDVLVKAARTGNFAALPGVDTAQEPAARGMTMEQLLAKGFNRRRPGK